MTGLQVLLVAMNGHVEAHLDVEIQPSAEDYAHWLMVPSPFAQLLKTAFAFKLAEDAFTSGAAGRQLAASLESLLSRPQQLRHVTSETPG